MKPTGTSEHGYSETLGGTRRDGTPLKHPMSEIGQRSTKSKNRYEDPPASQCILEIKDRLKVPIECPEKYTPGEVIFVRSRIFYSKPVYNARGDVRFGLRHIRMFP